MRDPDFLGMSPGLAKKARASAQVSVLRRLLNVGIWRMRVDGVLCAMTCSQASHIPWNKAELIEVVW